ncbi:MAG: glycerol-3-phosphate [Gallionellaceae bacterium]|nr:MAG: glycerol-3-phosphate [Gallionellaceae bacterium]
MKRDPASLTSSQFDLLVCGGGIYGAWTAYDAALRGLKVALVEQGDWAGATSSASSKLIHGGLRYLESYDFKLVKKALTERGMLLETAPHRVWPLRFGVPVYAHSRIFRLQLKAGLVLYDLLARISDAGMCHRYFNRSKFAQRFSALSPDGLRGGFTYADAQTDDARLVLELVAGAMDAGAVCVNYCELIESSIPPARGKEQFCATVRDKLNGQSFVVQTRQVVHTTGQWLTASEISRAWCRLSKGVHLILPKMLGEEALLLTAKSDGRVFFMIPWYGLTLVGTTDTDYRGDIEHVDVEKADVEYLLREVNHYFNTQWAQGDVIGSYAGVRVMRQSDDASPSAVSRDWELKTAGNGVFYSVGGKLTSARGDVAVIVDAVCAQLEVDISCRTKGRVFPWAPDDFTAWSEAVVEQAQRLGIDAESAKWLMRRHGKRTSAILRDVEINSALATRIVPALPFIYADLLFCAREEMVVYLDDLLRRRMPLLILAKLTESELGLIAQAVAEILGWDEAKSKQEVGRCVAFEKLTAG